MIMKEQIREVQKYFEEKISNGEFEVRRVSEHNTMEISIDECTFNLGYVKSDSKVFQHFFPNFIELDLSKVNGEKFINLHKKLVKETKLKAIEKLETEIQGL
jgi:hypothetical protein